MSTTPKDRISREQDMTQEILKAGRKTQHGTFNRKQELEKNQNINLAKNDASDNRRPRYSLNISNAEKVGTGQKVQKPEQTWKERKA